MKSQEPQEKKFRELSEEDLKNVTGGGLIQLIDFSCELVGMVTSTDENGQSTCVPA